MRPIRRLRSQASRWIARKAIQTRSPVASRNLSRIASVIRPPTASARMSSRVGKKLNVLRFAIDKRKFRAAGFVGFGLLAASVPFVVKGFKAMTADQTNELISALLKANLFAAGSILSFKSAHSLFSLVEAQKKLFQKLINKPHIGLAIANRIKDPSLKRYVIFFSQTRFIPASEKKALMESMYAKEGKAPQAMLDAFQVAQGLNTFHRWDRNLTTRLANLFFREVGRGNPVQGNTPASRQNLLQTLIHFREMMDSGLITNSVFLEVQFPDLANPTHFKFDRKPDGTWAIKRIPHPSEN